jgi:hypothetical protein
MHLLMHRARLAALQDEFLSLERAARALPDPRHTPSLRASLAWMLDAATELANATTAKPDALPRLMDDFGFALAAVRAEVHGGATSARSTN